MIITNHLFKKIILFIISLHFLFIFSGGLPAQAFFSDGQPPRFMNLDRSQGLISLAVSSIQQDKYGFMWLGSQGGLHRYDGFGMTVYTHEPFNSNSLPSDLVQTLKYDEARNVLWVGTYNGLSRFDIDTATFHNYTNRDGDTQSLSHGVVVAIEIDGHGDVWVGTLDGLNRFDPELETFDRIETVDKTIRTLLLDSENRLWVGSYGGLQYWDFSLSAMVTPDLDLPTPYVMTVIEPEPGWLLMGLWDGGLLDYYPATGELKAYDVPDKRIYSVLRSRDGTIWAGSWGGGLWARPLQGNAAWFKDSDTSEIANSVVYSLYEDTGGLVWVGTNGGGVHLLSPRRRNYRMYHTGETSVPRLEEGRIAALHRTSDNILWVGLYGNGLTRINEETREMKIYRHDPDRPGSISDDIVNAVQEDSRGNFWISTNVGLNLFDREKEVFYTWNEDLHPETPLSSRIVYYVEEDLQGRLWISTYGGGLNRWNPETGEMKVFNHDEKDFSSLSDNLVYRTLITRNGEVWAATNNGLNLFLSDEEGFQRFVHDFDNPETITANNTRTLTEDSRGHIWVGTYNGGLNRYDRERNRFYHYTTVDGLASNNILSVLEGDDGRIWAATRAGISILDPRTGEIGLLDERDGLFGTYFNSGHLKNSDGSLYFGGSHGITRVDTVTSFKNRHLPRVHITSVNVFEKPLETDRAVLDGETLKFDYSENFISFGFVALDFESPRHNQFSYKLEGFDRGWIYSGQRSYASYTNLPPGEYVFRVRAANNDGFWTEEGTSLNIIVSNPWYRTWWAYLIYSLSVLAILTLVWRLREGQLLKAQNSKLEQANEALERANEELEKLSIRDPLTGVYNRRFFMKSFEEDFLRARRGRYSFAVLMIDIDHFKKFNDYYGHVVGDRAITLVAQSIQESITRETDYVARYGGEEFVVVLFQADREGAEMVAQKLQEALGNLEIPTFKESESERVYRGLTVSVGVSAGVPALSEKAEGFLQKADNALYKAKEEGRNRICTAD